MFFFLSPYHNNLPMHMYDHFDYLMYLVKGRVHESPRIQLKRDRTRLVYYRFMYERFPLPTTLIEDSPYYFHVMLFWYNLSIFRSTNPTEMYVSLKQYMKLQFTMDCTQEIDTGAGTEIEISQDKLALFLVFAWTIKLYKKGCIWLWYVVW